MEPSKIADMVRLARNGTEQGYKSLVSEYGSSLLGYFLRNTGNLADSEDLVQEVFVRIVKGLKNYREERRFGVWVFQIAHNLLIDHWRKRKVVLESDISDESDGIIADLTIHNDNPLEKLAKRENSDELQRALSIIPAVQREVILMRYFSGLSFDQIAKINGTPIGTSLARAHRGLERLKKLLKAGAGND